MVHGGGAGVPPRVQLGMLLFESTFSREVSGFQTRVRSRFWSVGFAGLATVS